MRPVFAVLPLLVLCFILATTAALADGKQSVQFSISDQISFGRLILPVPVGTSLMSKRVGDDIVLDLSKGFVLTVVQSDHAPGIVSVVPSAGRLTVHLSPGATSRSVWVGRRFILNVVPLANKVLLQPGSLVVSPPVLSSGPVSSGVLPGLPAPLIAVVDGVKPVSSAKDKSTTLAQPTPIALPPVVAAVQAGKGDAVSEPVSIEASVISGLDGKVSSLFLPFGPDVGAAAFRRGNDILVVFDTCKPVDLSPISRDPTYGQARFALLTAGAVMRLRAPPPAGVSLKRVKEGWVVAPIGATERVAQPVRVSAGLSISMTSVGKVVVVPDPVDGLELLVGTVRQDGQRLADVARGPGYRLAPTFLGVVAERWSDQTELRSVADGFLLEDPLQAISAAVNDAPADSSRAIEQPNVNVAELWRRYRAGLAESAALPPGSRRMARLDAARAALALGFGREARRLAMIAEQDAPIGPDQAGSAFLTGAGALLDADDDAALLLADPRIGNNDEAILWRALAVARQNPGDRAAARTIASQLKLLISYPENLRRALLGDAAMSLVVGGDPTAKALVSRLSGGAKIGFAQALLAEGDHHDVSALPQLDRLSADADPLVSMQAAREAIELRLAAGQLTAGQAAERLASHIYDGRMAGIEPSVRLKVAALRAQARDWSGALSDLRTARQMFPEIGDQVSHAADTILRTIADSQSSNLSDLSKVQDPLSAVGLIENNEDLLPAGADKTALLLAMANRLTALDLPDRAAGFLASALAKSTSATDRARFGLALARLQLEQANLNAARATLDSTEAPSQTETLVKQRAILRGQLLEAAGDHDGALLELSTLQDPDALELRARILAAKKDWSASVPVLTALLSSQTSHLVPGASLDTKLEDLVLRLAGAMSQSGQQASLAALDKEWSPRFADTAHRDMLRLLAAPDVKSAADLPQSAVDLAASRNALALLDAHPTSTKP